MKVLGVRTEVDSVLSAVAPLGLAAAAGTALMVDLDPQGPPYPSARSLADLVADGPRRDELTPQRQGVAVLRNGGVGWEQSAALVVTLAEHWPAVVLRVGADRVEFPVVPVVPLLPGMLAPAQGRVAVWQAMAKGSSAPGAGPVLPAISRTVMQRLLEGTVDPRGRWVTAWERVWRLPWR
jgi:hypothetical protein